MENGFRVRPHVARAVAGVRHVLLDYDGLCFVMPDGAGPWEVFRALPQTPWAHFSRSMPYMLWRLATHEPELAAAAEPIASAVELDGALTARMTRGLPEVLATGAAAGRRMWVVGGISETAMRAGLRAHGLESRVAEIAGRHGLDGDTLGVVNVAVRAARVLGVDPARCLLVSGRGEVLRAAGQSGFAVLGVPCGHDTRKWLGDYAPVVTNLERLGQALTARGGPG
ncbi:hypothetical protein Q0Z83_033800 [Actinoplanes sichuanensis]|uniref:Uncharacterized protein n=1 Tax=Actinoplanes sichuanensis TaxID=512349 RepID=A0ABW4A6E5_9ACTN|nr:hypothetical protein [Actinoplanes sichuanensis]BEL05189.1 hypothetical protein Q0Z83_033800 [Actinoplanes sichuanensis]